MSSSQDHTTGNDDDQGFDKKHLAIALGIGLSIVALITMCLLYDDSCLLCPWHLKKKKKYSPC